MEVAKVKLERRQLPLPQSKLQALDPPLPWILIHTSGIGACLQASLAPPIHQPPKRGRLASAPSIPLSDTIQPASVADQAGVARGGGVGGAGLGSPASERQATSGLSNRKRNASLAGFDSSPGTVESPEADGSEDGNHEGGRKQPVKRACNECRQQKVSHNPVVEKTKASSLVMFLTYSARTLTAILASLQCHPRTLPPMFPLRATSPRMQNREQLQACWQKISQCGDGEGDSRPQEAAWTADKQCTNQRNSDNKQPLLWGRRICQHSSH